MSSAFSSSQGFSTIEAMNGLNNTKSFKTGERIITQGDPAAEAYLIATGKVRVFLEQDGKEVKLATLGEGDIFGENALFGGENVYGAHVEALEDCILSPITAQDFQGQLEGCNPDLQVIIRTLLDRLQKTNEKLLESETREFMDIVLV